MQQDAIRIALQVSQWKIHEEHRSMLVAVISRDDSCPRSQQDLARILSRRDEAWILQVPVLVAPELSPGSTLKLGRRRREGEVFPRGHTELFHERNRATHVARSDHPGAQVLLSCVIHSGQIGYARWAAWIKSLN